jgi:hypothetical protein
MLASGSGELKMLFNGLIESFQIFCCVNVQILEMKNWVAAVLPNRHKNVEEEAFYSRGCQT